MRLSLAPNPLHNLTSRKYNRLRLVGRVEDLFLHVEYAIK